jgi:hypothetical protein
LRITPHQIYGFAAECRRVSSSLGKSCPLNRSSLELFEWLPVAAVVSGVVLILHGGIGDGTWSLQQLRDIQRPVTDDILDVSVLDVFCCDCFFARCASHKLSRRCCRR